KHTLWGYRLMVMEPYETHRHQGAEAVTDAQREHSDQSGHEAHDDHVDHDDHGDHNGHPGHDDHLRHADHSEHSGHEEHSGHAGHSGHGGHAHHVAQFRRLFWIMLIIAVPVVDLSPPFGPLLGCRVGVTGVLGVLRGLSPILGTVMYFWGGKPYLTGGLDEIQGRSPGMMLLIPLAITVAF